MRVDLCWLGGRPPPAWQHGDVICGASSVREVHDVMRTQASKPGHATLFWDSTLGEPPRDVMTFLDRRVDVVHAGLALGTSGLPRSIDFINPTWMWNADPPATGAGTSWRISLRACVIVNDVIAQLGGVQPAFRTLEGAALELGHRYLTRGAFVRHDARLVAGGRGETIGPLPVHDELLFATLRYGTFWARWAAGRGVLTGTYSPRDIVSARGALGVARPPEPTYVRTRTEVTVTSDSTVSVIVPTLERYPYLRTLLGQLARQTHPATEIIVIDQTPTAERDRSLSTELPGLPVRWIEQDIAGQCTARNLALQLARGDFVLFLDDDVEGDERMVERHLRTLLELEADVSNGVVDENGVQLPESHTFLRASDVFPTGNTMIRRSILATSGTFDLAYDGKMCEDGDLGMRLYLAGARMVLDPSIRLFHHRAPRGGLRAHGARKVTFASSRTRITDRSVPHASQVYLAMRYFKPHHVREMLALAQWGTLRGRGSRMQQLAKAAFGIVKLPTTRAEIHDAEASARSLFGQYPNIGQL